MINNSTKPAVIATKIQTDIIFNKNNKRPIDTKNSDKDRKIWKGSL